MLKLVGLNVNVKIYAYKVNREERFAGTEEDGVSNRLPAGLNEIKCNFYFSADGIRL